MTALCVTPSFCEGKNTMILSFRSVLVLILVIGMAHGLDAGVTTPATDAAALERDWRMQDGIGTARRPVSYAQAIEKTLDRGDRLLDDLRKTGTSLTSEATDWAALRARWKRLSTRHADEAQWHELWLTVHRLRRHIVFANPLLKFDALAFVKQAPAMFSHQLTQYAGRHARPGGGVFVLDHPGQSLQCRALTPARLPRGSYQHLDVSFDGKRLLFSFCRAESDPPAGIDGAVGRRFHLFEMNADGGNPHQLTHGPYDDFSPRYLPNGRIVFISTRRGGWHRCGGSPGHGCENFTLALADGDGAHPHAVSYHETQEWDPAVLNDGRVIYTRWDYVDRHAVYYEQLWTVRPDGTAPSIYYGNNTLNPIGIWEARAVPNSNRVMATAGAHHAMTAGSIILVNVDRAVDGTSAITRLTPDALFPESETYVPPKNWHNAAGVAAPPPVPIEAERWPGHCYRSPYPLSPTYFLAAYSYQSLVGEPAANPANMFGIYVVDAFGNKELLYRDPEISSVWPMPIRSRRRPPTLTDFVEAGRTGQGTVFVQNVYDSAPAIPPGSVKRLRIVQILPKTTPGINSPTVGIPNASPGKQVLGTVPVEPDGSAHFQVPAGKPIAFQALDQFGRAVQVMRSLTYVQPGETLACAGCHERRTTAPRPGSFALAMQRPPSTITPGPDGSKPFSYPLLVQGVLDKHCVRCHNAKKAEGHVVLTGTPEGRYTRSYNALARRVTYASWGGRPGDFRKVNDEPLATPGFFGSLSCHWLQQVLDGKHYVTLAPDDIDRLTTWMDANALFYGTFDPADQERQRHGLRIAGPTLE